MDSKPRRTAVYIDGYNLYYGRLRHTAHKWLDVVALFEAILRIRARLLMRSSCLARPRLPSLPRTDKSR